MENRRYLILSGEIVVAEWENRELRIVNPALLPLFLRRVPDVDKWLETRAIDSHRANSRLLKKALRLREKDDVSAAYFVNGATVTDNYWIKPADSSLTYADIRFDNDYFSRLALKGTYDSFNKAATGKVSRTPELTNIGSFEKCWKLRSGKWWMYKKANHDEMFSELFVCAFGKALGIHVAEYARGDGYVKTENFTGGVYNFEPAMSFMGDNEEYADVLSVLKEICPNAVGDYIRMLYLDTLIANPDRHTGNFGLLRDPQSGTLLGLAPLFDHNMALISRGYPKMTEKPDLLIDLFNEVLRAEPDLAAYIPTVNADIISSAIAGIGMRVKSRYITEFILARDALILKS